MTLDEAIKHAEEVAEEAEQDCEFGFGNRFIDRTEGLECAAEHKQLAEWLKDYKQLKEQTLWIPIKYHEATEQEIKENGYPFDVCYILENPMPSDEQDILVTIKTKKNNLYVVKDVCYFDDGFHLDSGYDWLTDVVAWMPLPEPYKEGEE